MIQLIDRSTVFSKYKNITTEISEMQKAFFEEEYLERLCETENERNDYLNLFDAKHFSLPAIAKTYKKIEFDHTDLKTFARTLTDKLKSLLAEINVNKFVIVSHYRLPFVGNIDNKYPPLQRVFRKFKAITNDIEYHEAIETDFQHLFDLIDIAFWIERCDPSGPEFIFFHDVEERLSFNICKYGTVHVIEYQNEYLTEKLLNRNGWYLVEDSCFEKFSKDGKIKGRRLKI